MTTCAYCKARKSKRTCPALGAICSACCGEHRVDHIPCPPDCGYLGVDALRLPAPTPHVISSEALTSAREKLFTFEPPLDWREDAGRAFDLLGDRRNLPGWGYDLVARYLLSGYRRVNGERMIDRFIATRLREFTLAEGRALLAFSRALISLYKITALRPGSVSLRNLVSGERLELSSEDVVGYRNKGDVLFASVVDCGNRKEFEGLDLLLPPPLVSTVSGAFRRALREARNQWPALTDEELGGNAAPVVLRALLEVRSLWEAHEDYGARNPGAASAEGLS